MVSVVGVEPTTHAKKGCNSQCRRRDGHTHIGRTGLISALLLYYIRLSAEIQSANCTKFEWVGLCRLYKSDREWEIMEGYYLLGLYFMP